MPFDDTVRFTKAQGRSSPDKLRLIAEAFNVSLYVAALRVHEDLKLWKRSIGLWRHKDFAEEVWFVGKRPWKERSLHWFAFESAVRTSGTIKTQERFFVGDEERTACLEILDLGCNGSTGCHHVLAMVV
jgi:hypothetical protein